MTKELTPAEVQHIAQLAKLQLSEEEMKQFQLQLTETLKFIAHLNEIETEKILPTSQVSGNKDVFREDVIRPSLTQEQALSGAKRKHQGYFLTKAIF